MSAPAQEFKFELFTSTFPDGVSAELAKEGFDTLPALLCADSDALGDLRLKRGHLCVVRQAITELQTLHKQATPPTQDTHSVSDPSLDKLCTLLGALSTKDHQQEGTTAATGQSGSLRIVDFVPSTMLAEEEVALGGGVTLKVNAKPKLEKVTFGMWIAANAKILQKLMDGDKQFDVRSYLKYTAMIGELATRFTWVSVMLFDDEYRQRQAENKSAWGTEAPHLSTVTLRERPPQQVKGRPGSNTTRPAAGPAGREVCRLFNKGTCTYGAACKFDHVCGICGNKEHASRDHPASTGSAPTVKTTNTNQ